MSQPIPTSQVSSCSQRMPRSLPSSPTIAKEDTTRSASAGDSMESVAISSGLRSPSITSIDLFSSGSQSEADGEESSQAIVEKSEEDSDKTSAKRSLQAGIPASREETDDDGSFTIILKGVGDRDPIIRPKKTAKRKINACKCYNEKEATATEAEDANNSSGLTQALNSTGLLSQDAGARRADAASKEEAPQPKRARSSIGRGTRTVVLDTRQLHFVDYSGVGHVRIELHRESDR